MSNWFSFDGNRIWVNLDCCASVKFENGIATIYRHTDEEEGWTLNAADSNRLHDYLVDRNPAHRMVS